MEENALSKFNNCLESWAMPYVSTKSFGIILVMISSICFAFVPNSAKIALDEGTSLSFLLVSRYAIGVALLSPIMFLKKTKFPTSNDIVQRIIIASMLALGLIWATYHAVELLDVGLVLIILYSFPIGVALVSHLQGKIVINFRQIACMFLLLFGLWTMIYEDGVSVNFYGLVVSFVGLICFVFFIISASELVEQTITSLEQLSDRLNEITGELQNAAKEKINLSRTKLNALSQELRGMVAEIESFAKISVSTA